MTKSATRPIVITGFMGAGKTTVAQAIAQRLKSLMLDLDEIIVEREKRSISTLIEEEGEAQFRNRETFSLEFVLEKRLARVIALGGGTWIVEKNRSLIAQHDCLTVWLDAPFELCWKRITNEDTIRPLALDRQSAHHLFQQRRPLYALAMWHLHVTEETSAEELASEIINIMQRQRYSKS